MFKKVKDALAKFEDSADRLNLLAISDEADYSRIQSLVQDLIKVLEYLKRKGKKLGDSCSRIFDTYPSFLLAYSDSQLGTDAKKLYREIIRASEPELSHNLFQLNLLLGPELLISYCDSSIINLIRDPKLPKPILDNVFDLLSYNQPMLLFLLALENPYLFKSITITRLNRCRRSTLISQVLEFTNKRRPQLLQVEIIYQAMKYSDFERLFDKDGYGIEVNCLHYTPNYGYNFPGGNPRFSFHQSIKERKEHLIQEELNQINKIADYLWTSDSNGYDLINSILSILVSNTRLIKNSFTRRTQR